MRVLVVANDHVGSQMAGPGIRSYRFAVELAKRFDVTLSVPYETDLRPDGFELVVANPYVSRAMTPLARRFDAVVSQRLPFPTLRALSRSSVRTVLDLYTPALIENLAFEAGTPLTRAARSAFELNLLVQEAALRHGDAFICASEKQRDLWLGSLLALGRVDHDAYGADPALRNLIDVVPFGIEPEPPAPANALRGVVPGIDGRSRILLWPGGIWNWLDPLTVIRAVADLRQSHPGLCLVFLGTAHPNPRLPAMAMTGRAFALAEELGLRDTAVHFNAGWVPYEQRGGYLLEADLGVSAHFHDLESRFSYRTRLLDCFWAGLPVVATEGDALSDLVAERGLGRTVPPGDVDAWRDAIASLLDDDAALARAREELAAVRDDLAWPRVVEPLARLLAAQPATGTRSVLAGSARYAVRRLDHAVAARGAAGTARRLAEVVAAAGAGPLGSLRRRRRPLPSTKPTDE